MRDRLGLAAAPLVRERGEQAEAGERAGEEPDRGDSEQRLRLRALVRVAAEHRRERGLDVPLERRRTRELGLERREVGLQRARVARVEPVGSTT